MMNDVTAHWEECFHPAMSASSCRAVQKVLRDLSETQYRHARHVVSDRLAARGRSNVLSRTDSQDRSSVSRGLSRHGQESPDDASTRSVIRMWAAKGPKGKYAGYVLDDRYYCLYDTTQYIRLFTLGSLESECGRSWVSLIHI